MKTRFVLRTCLLSIALLAGGACLAARLNNSFDLKGPKGLMGYIVAFLPGTSPCVFDAAEFESCPFGP